MAQVLDQVNAAIEQLMRSRNSVAQQIAQLQEQLAVVPKQIEDNIEKATKMLGDMDAVIAAAQVVVVNPSLLDETELQIEHNLELLLLLPLHLAQRLARQVPAEQRRLVLLAAQNWPVSRALPAPMRVILLRERAKARRSSLH